MAITVISKTLARTFRGGAVRAWAATLKQALSAVGVVQLQSVLLGPTAKRHRWHAPKKLRAPRAQPAAPAQGQFITLAHSVDGVAKEYKLFIPAVHVDKPLPLIIMLHGCKQNPDDFAAGTRMNQLAEREGFLVAYPWQTARENCANCWNWYESSQQSRSGGEPSLIAGIVGDIAQAYAVDTTRVFVAGLSAGAAMAVILGSTHPDVFAGVAAHSGLPVGAANSVLSAYTAMQGFACGPSSTLRMPAVPTIVIHGDADGTVASANGDAIVQQSVLAYQQSDVALEKRHRPVIAPGSKKSTTTEYVDSMGRSRIEEWVVHGGSHAWFGGSVDGSYTDVNGPDASEEIVRFFLGPARQAVNCS